jgi:putative hydrolase of the HAD superfamily
MRRRPHRMPAVVIMDMDGVLRHWDPAIMSRAERDAGLPPGSLVDAVLADEKLLRLAVTGRMSDDEWRSEIARRLARRSSTVPAAAAAASAARAVAAWSAPAGEVDREVLALIRRMRKRVPVALFSNATTRLARDLDALDLTEELDIVINSADLGLAKPEPAAFAEAARRCGQEPGECLFVDDTAANVTGARAAGMPAHRFDGPDGLRALLADIGLVDHPGS